MNTHHEWAAPRKMWHRIRMTGRLRAWVRLVHPRDADKIEVPIY